MGKYNQTLVKIFGGALSLGALSACGGSAPEPESPADEPAMAPEEPAPVQIEIGSTFTGDNEAAFTVCFFVDVDADLTRLTITLSDLRGLEVGDLLMTDKTAGAPIVLTVGGNPKFLAHIGQHRGNRALRIDRPIQASDRL